MITKGPSPTMRHLSRTHRVALDWLFDRINFEPKIQIEYVDQNRTRNHADVNNVSCFLQPRQQSAMSKRGEKATSNEGSPMAKARPC